MYRWALLCVFLRVLCELVPGVIAARRFYPNFFQDIGDYQYIYHDDHDLLLVLYNNSCYFMDVPDNTTWSLELVNLHVSTKLQQLVEQTIHGDVNSGTVSASSLTDMRDRFEDRLADFHCLDKHVYHFDISLQQQTTTVAQTTPTTTTTTTTHPTTTHPTTTQPTTTHPTHTNHPTTTQPTTTHPIHTNHPTTTHPITTHPTTTHPTHPTTTTHRTTPQPTTTHPTTTHPTTTHTTTPPTTVHDCHNLESHNSQLGMDLAFLLDMGPNVHNNDFNAVKQFIIGFISHFILVRTLQVSVTQNADQPQMAFDFSAYPQHPLFSSNVEHLPTLHTTSQASTAKALQFVRDHVFQPASGDRPEAPNVLVVVTDGENMHDSQHQQLVQQAHLLHGDNVYVIVLNVEHNAHFNSDAGVLATERDSYLNVGGYNQLHTIMTHLKNILCNNLFSE